jgi:hypothetical protein
MEKEGEAANVKFNLLENLSALFTESNPYYQPKGQCRRNRGNPVCEDGNPMPVAGRMIEADPRSDLARFVPGKFCNRFSGSLRLNRMATASGRG